MKIAARLMILVLAILSSLSAFAQNSFEISFETPRNFAVPGDVHRVATGDFNNDGKSDAATAGPSGIYFLLGDGAGNLSAPVLVNATPSRVITAADFNGDGNLDLVNGSAQVFLGNGGGGFSAGPTLGASDTLDLDIADFNNDNKLDLVIPITGAIQFTILFGDGAGGFSSTIIITGPSNGISIIGMGTVAVGDFDGDADIDAALPILRHFFTNPGVAIFLNDGSGNFPSEENVLTFSSAYDVLAGDFNNDGNLDLAGPADNGWRGFATFGDGTGSFTGQNPYLIDSWLDLNIVADGDSLKSWLLDGASLGSPNFAVSDFNFDGVTDVANWSVVDGLHILSYTGEFENDEGELNSIASFTDLVIPGTVSDISIADFNRDCKPDIVASSVQNGNVSVIINSSSGTFPGPFLVDPVFDTTRAFKVGSTVPIKLKLNNQCGVNASSANTVVNAYELRLVGGTTSSPVIDSGNANPDSNFRFVGDSGGAYLFNLSTRGLAAGTYKLYFHAGNNVVVAYDVQFEIK